MPSAKRVLLVDDRRDVRSSLAEQLEQEDGFSPVEAGSCAEASQLAHEGLYEFMILDVGLRMETAVRFAVSSAAKEITCPIILLTAKDSDSDIVEGLKSGANDHISKPFRFAVLAARIHAHLRSHEQSEEAVYRIGPYTFRPSAKMLLDPKGRRSGLRKRRPTSSSTCIAPARRLRARRCCTKSGLQSGGHHHTLETPHLSAAPEDREQSGRGTDFGDGKAAATGWRPEAGQFRTSLGVCWPDRAALTFLRSIRTSFAGLCQFRHQGGQDS